MWESTGIGQTNANHVQGDVGGQKTLRTYWKNYFEKTDTLIWVVDSTDASRLSDCSDELKKLLVEEVQENKTNKQMPKANTHPAVNGSQPPRLQKQERRPRLSERRGDPKGNLDDTFLSTNTLLYMRQTNLD